MDEQRCELPKPIGKSKSTEDMLDMVERVQGDRMEEQRSDLPSDDETSQMPVLSTFDSHAPSSIVSFFETGNLSYRNCFHLEFSNCPI